MYDITNKDRFISIYRWMNEIKEQTSQHICLALIGNKIDIDDKRTVKYEEAKEFALNNDLLFAEASALTGTNVENVFTMISADILKKIETGVIDMTKEHTGIRVGQGIKKKTCC